MVDDSRGNDQGTFLSFMYRRSFLLVHFLRRFKEER